MGNEQQQIQIQQDILLKNLPKKSEQTQKPIQQIYEAKKLQFVQETQNKKGQISKDPQRQSSELFGYLGDEYKKQQKIRQNKIQIQEATSSYAILESQNLQKLQKMRQQKQNLKKIYQDYDSMEESQEQQQKQKQDEKVLIWGKMVTLQKKDPMDYCYSQKYPKEQTNPANGQVHEYKNWKTYKKQMAKQKNEEIQKKEAIIKKHQTSKNNTVQKLKFQIQMLSGQAIHKKPQNPKKSPRTYQESNQKDVLSDISEKLHEQNNQSDKQLDLLNMLKQVQSQKNENEKPSLPKNQYKTQDQTLQTQMAGMNLNFLPRNNPQNMDQKQSDADFLARQIFYFQTYKTKRQGRRNQSYSTFVSSFFNQNPYDTDRKTYKPQRTINSLAEFHQDYAVRQKSKKKGSRKSKVSGVNNQDEIRSYKFKEEQSMYMKVYEKIPNREKTITIYSDQDGKLKDYKNYYPCQSITEKAEKRAAFPQKILVSDGLFQNSQNLTIPVAKDVENLEFQKNQTTALALQIKKKETAQRLPKNSGISFEQIHLSEQEQNRRNQRIKLRQMEVKLLEKVRIRGL